MPVNGYADEIPRHRLSADVTEQAPNARLENSITVNQHGVFVIHYESCANRGLRVVRHLLAMMDGRLDGEDAIAKRRIEEALGDPG
jgi:hypothetical protein